MLSNEINKNLFGFLVSYYRKKANKSRIAFVNEINKKSNGSCSISSLSRIENGQDILHDDIYETIINGVGYELELDSYSSCFICDYCHRIFDLINSGQKITSYTYLYNEISSLNLKHKNSFYISQFYRLYIAVLEAYLYNKISDYEIAHIFDNNLDILDHDSRCLASYLIYKSAILHFDSEIFNNDFTFYGKQLNGMRLFYLEQASYDVSTMSVTTMSKKYLDLYQARDYKNPIFTFSILSALACCELNLGDFEASLKRLKESLEITNIEKIIPDTAILQTYKRMGINEFNTKNYKDSFYYLNHVRKENSNSLGMNYLLLIKSAEFAGFGDVIVSIVKDANKIQSNRLLKRVFSYYKIKYIDQGCDIDLENYINKNLTKSNFTSTIYSNIFLEEITEIVSRTKHYIALYNFLTK